MRIQYLVRGHRQAGVASERAREREKMGETLIMQIITRRVIIAQLRIPRLRASRECLFPLDLEAIRASETNISRNTIARDRFAVERPSPFRSAVVFFATGGFNAC